MLVVSIFAALGACKDSGSRGMTWRPPGVQSYTLGDRPGTIVLSTEATGTPLTRLRVRDLHISNADPSARRKQWCCSSCSCDTNGNCDCKQCTNC